MNAIAKFNSTQISTIKRTVASGLNNEEFDLFIENASQAGLDPFRGQIIPMIFNANKPDKRKMTMVISRDGLRCIAARCGDYRPASKPTTYETDESLKDPSNPHGIISATVYLHKKDQKTGEWFDVVGEAYWEEFAPVSYPFNAYNMVDSGDTWPDGNPKKNKVLKEGAKKALDDSGQWAKMPRLMITKCAEAQALRAGWPEEFTGLYAEEEMDASQLRDITPSEIAEEASQANLALKFGHTNTLPAVFMEGLEMIPLGDFHDRWVKMIDENKDSPSRIVHMFDQNREGLLKFFSHDKSAALDLKKRREQIEKQINELQAS